MNKLKECNKIKTTFFYKEVYKILYIRIVIVYLSRKYSIYKDLVKLL